MQLPNAEPTVYLCLLSQPDTLQAMPVAPAPPLINNSRAAALAKVHTPAWNLQSAQLHSGISRRTPRLCRTPARPACCAYCIRHTTPFGAAGLSQSTACGLAGNSTSCPNATALAISSQAERPPCAPGGGPVASGPGGRPGSEAPRDVFEWPGELPNGEEVEVMHLDPIQLVDEAKL